LGGAEIYDEREEDGGNEEMNDEGDIGDIKRSASNGDIVRHQGMLGVERM
jgi:hypothetical protein